MGILNLFGSSKNVEAVVETAAKGIYNGIDMLVHTDEEKVIATQKGVDSFLKFAEIANNQNSIQSITRRWLAFMIVGPTILIILTQYVLALFILWVEPVTATILSGSIVHLSTMAAQLTPWAGGVLGFYFGTHIIRAIGSIRGDK